MGGRGLAANKKNARRKRAWLIFEDESGVTERPPVRRTWAPKGKTPVLIHPFNWKKLSVAGALAYRWDGRRSDFVFRTQRENFNPEGIIGFLRALKRHFRGRKLILLWDRLPAHKAGATQAYLRSQRHWLTTEWLPTYAPELNPVELVWGHGKGAIANQDVDDLDDVADAWRRALRSISYPLASAFLRHAGLPIA